MASSFVWLLPAVFLVAALYASVGHGGGSGYLALLALSGALDPVSMSTTALLLNVLVSGIGAVTFARAGHLVWALTWPFLVLSVPLAFAGGVVSVPPRTYAALLSAALGIAALRMAQTARSHGLAEAKAQVLATGAPDGGALDSSRPPHPGLATALPTGAGIGLVSGIVGVGGGIFLSPLMMFRRWGSARQVAATAAVFVLANSIAGLAGRASVGNLSVGELWPLLLVAAIGGLAGSRMGAHHIDGVGLRYALSAVLVIAALKAALLALHG